MSQRHFKSGMGTDTDPIRLGLLILTVALGIESYRHHDGLLGGVLLVGALVAAVALGWWVTRAIYLDRIEDLEEDRSQDAPTPSAVVD